MEDTKSPAIELLTQVWNGVHHNKTWSWVKLNSCMAKALRLAIEAGLTFYSDDFFYISKSFRWGWWAGNGEQYYSRAVSENNMSAIRALEKAWERKPFIVNKVYPPYDARSRQRGRLAVGARFQWNGKWATVTSFNDKEGKVVACSYKPFEYDERGYCIGGKKVEHVLKLTHKEVKARNQNLKSVAPLP